MRVERVISRLKLLSSEKVQTKNVIKEAVEEIFPVSEFYTSKQQNKRVLKFVGQQKNPNNMELIKNRVKNELKRLGIKADVGSLYASSWRGPYQYLTVSLSDSVWQGVMSPPLKQNKDKLEIKNLKDEIRFNVKEIKEIKDSMKMYNTGDKGDNDNIKEFNLEIKNHEKEIKRLLKLLEEKKN